MHISASDQHGVTVFVLEGRVDSAGAGEMDGALQSAAAQGKNKMVLDMSGVTYINSAGLRTLADVLTQNRANGGDLRLVSLSPKVERVFKIIGFDKFFETYTSVDAAAGGF
ncbi:MAG: anti-sigma factor antagonist [Chloroflexi bacterium]|nr:MAG: anti-sigma factor antagonist [Chloroflexota bacterium]